MNLIKMKLIQRVKNIFKEYGYLIVAVLLLDANGSSSQIVSEDDFYTFPKSVTLRDGQQFDYIVVGAGAGGATAASRLALAGHDVLLVEAGGNPNLLTRIPAASFGLLGSDVDWQYKTISNNVSCLSSDGQQCRFSRGKCLGGSTSINYMLYTRGNRLRDFEEIPFPGWTFNDLMPYFLRYEGLQDLSKLPSSSVPYHNTSGPMRIGFFDDPQNPFQSELINAYESLKFPYNSDVNAASQIGVTKLIGYVYRGERMSTARGYLARNDVKKLLNIAKNTMCTGVIIREKTALGVTVVYRSKTLNIFARKEVVLSAGAIGTPQILMLSGVGVASHLNKIGIPVQVDLPVGDGLIDHALPLLILQVSRKAMVLDKFKFLVKTASQIVELLKRRGALTSNGLTDISIFANTYCYDFERRQLTNESSGFIDCEVPNLQIIHSYVERLLLPLVKPIFKKATSFNDNVINQLSEANKKYAFLILTPVLLEPRSVGTVRLASRDPLAPPAITPNYLGDERDVEEMVRSIRIVEDLVSTPTFQRWNASLLHLDLPGCGRYEARSSASYWRCYARHVTYAVYHAAGTAALGPVLDARLRVRGLARLRVADLSVLPRAPRANPSAVTIAIGERVVDFLLEDNK